MPGEWGGACRPACGRGSGQSVGRHCEQRSSDPAHVTLSSGGRRAEQALGGRAEPTLKETPSICDFVSPPARVWREIHCCSRG